jgi:hypothetical protein
MDEQAARFDMYLQFNAESNYCDLTFLSDPKIHSWRFLPYTSGVKILSNAGF